MWCIRISGNPYIHLHWYITREEARLEAQYIYNHSRLRGNKIIYPYVDKAGRYGF